VNAASVSTSQVSVERGATSGRVRQLIGIVGLTSFALIVIGAFVSPPLWNAPGETSSAVHVAAYLQANRGRTVASLYIYGLGMGLFLSFAAGLWSWLRQIEPAPQSLSAVFAFGAITLAVLVLASFATAGVASYRPQQPALAVALSDLTFGLLALSGIPTAVCLGAYAALVLRYRRLPGWTAWLAILAVIAHLAIAASFVSHGSFLSLEGAVNVAAPATLFAWLFATSVVLLAGRVDARVQMAAVSP
jgi:hypothetical protein